MRDEVKHKIAELFDQGFPAVRGRVIRLENGPPVGYPVQFRLLGPDPGQLRAIGQRMEAMLREHPATRQVNNDWGEQLRVMRVTVDQDKARALGVSSQSLARQLQMLLSGSVVTEYRDADRTLEVVVRLGADERASLERLPNLMIQTASGRFVPVAQLARVEYKPEESIVWRRNRLPTLTVRADVADGVQAADVSIALWPKMQALENPAAGYHIELGGSLESSKIAGRHRRRATLDAGGGDLLLMFQLHSFQRTLLVLLTAPLGMIGVTLTLILFAAPFGFVAMLGVIALAGMIMRNSVILVDQIEHDIREGIDRWEAVVGSTVRRFRPIMLTAAAAILAMIPLTRSTFWGRWRWPSWVGCWSPPC